MHNSAKRKNINAKYLASNAVMVAFSMPRATKIVSSIAE